MPTPSSPPRDPGAEIEAILRDAFRKIIALLRSEQEASLAALDERLARPSGEPAPAARRRSPPSRPPARGRKVPTTDVADVLRRLFATRRGALRLAELRAATGFGNMQLHRALGLLLDSGEIRKRGKLRKTEYLASSKPEAGRRPGARARRKDLR